MPNDFDGKSCKYGTAASGYCNKKPKASPHVCKHGRNPVTGYCNDRPADGRYGKPEDTTSGPGVAANNPPAASKPVVVKTANEIVKKNGITFKQAAGWVAVVSVIAGIVYAIYRDSEAKHAEVATRFANRELARTQNAIGRTLTEREAATLTGQYLAFVMQKYKDAAMADSKRPDDRERAFSALAFLRSI